MILRAKRAKSLTVLRKSKFLLLMQWSKQSSIGGFAAMSRMVRLLMILVIVRAKRAQSPMSSESLSFCSSCSGDVLLAKFSKKILVLLCIDQ